MEPKLSIIIPIYNVSDYLDNCINSIYNQMNDDIEVILVDDGSTDEKCPQICDKWSAMDTRIKVIHKKNGGLSDARNEGLKVAAGKYILFVDGDDSLESNAISVIMDHLKNEMELIVFNFKAIDDKTKIVLSQSEFRPEIIDISNSEKKIRFIAGKLTQHYIGWEAWNKVFNKDIIDKYNLSFYDNRIIFSEDLYFFLCYLVHINRITVINDVLYNYLIRKSSIMGNDSKKNNLGRFSLLSEQVYNHYMQFEECRKLVEVFPLINGQILFIEIPRTMKVENYSFKELIVEFTTKIPNREFQHRMIKDYSKYKKFIKNDFTDYQIQDRTSLMKYLYDGNYLKMRIRNRFFSFRKKILR